MGLHSIQKNGLLQPRAGDPEDEEEDEEKSKAVVHEPNLSLSIIKIVSYGRFYRN